MTKTWMQRINTHEDGPVKVRRTRNSNGYSSIEIVIEGDHHRPSLRFSTEDYGDGYESVALTVARLLDKAVDDRCELPEAKGDD